MSQIAVVHSVLDRRLPDGHFLIHNAEARGTRSGRHFEANEDMATRTFQDDQRKLCFLPH
eukprot:8773484-Pyramimonas_sp.AAC.1